MKAISLFRPESLANMQRLLRVLFVTIKVTVKEDSGTWKRSLIL